MRLTIGFGSFALVIGFLLGASNTPVIAPFLTAIFGLIGSIIGTEYLISKSSKTSTDVNAIGSIFLTASILLFFGTLIGESYRSGLFTNKEKVLPWNSSTAPIDTKEAIDWILVKEKLNEIGYSNSQVEAIYRIREREIAMLKEAIQQEQQSGVETYNQTILYDESSPFYKMFPTEITKSSGRGPASTN